MPWPARVATFIAGLTGSFCLIAAACYGWREFWRDLKEFLTTTEKS